MIHFIVGTRAQLFKMAPIMLKCEEKKLDWRWIYTAQHKETIDKSVETFGLPEPDIILMEWRTEAKTYGKMLHWLAKMSTYVFRGSTVFGSHIGPKNLLLTHGDTFTTWIGAMLARLNRIKVMHVESGLTSGNLFKPFPEEINRRITFRLSQYFACPGSWAIENLSKRKGKKINTHQNTQIDTLRFGIEHKDMSSLALPRDKYAVVSLHRYENIFKPKRFEEMILQVEKISRSLQILFVQHPATKVQIDKLGYRDRLAKNPAIMMLPRLNYLDYIKAISSAEFVVTDGGGNQEELYYLGIPTLLFRDETERREGLGSTALLSKLNPRLIDEFVKNYHQYRKKPVKAQASPSDIIVKAIIKFGFGAEKS